ncbi:MAG: hypothetical protein WA958_12625 [Tunicatimonas sp.]
MENAEKKYLSLAEYNQLEEETNQRYEYHDGRRGTGKYLRWQVPQRTLGIRYTELLAEI